MVHKSLMSQRDFPISEYSESTDFLQKRDLKREQEVFKERKYPSRLWYDISLVIGIITFSEGGRGVKKKKKNKKH